VVVMLWGGGSVGWAVGGTSVGGGVGGVGANINRACMFNE